MSCFHNGWSGNDGGTFAYTIWPSLAQIGGVSRILFHDWHTAEIGVVVLSRPSKWQQWSVLCKAWVSAGMEGLQFARGWCDVHVMWPLWCYDVPHTRRWVMWSALNYVGRTSEVLLIGYPSRYCIKI